MTKQRKLLYIGAEKCKGIVHLSCLHCGKTAHMEQEDAAACCAQGLEFEPESTLSYPDDYPEPGAEITVTGTFDSYREEVDGNTCIYLVLRNVLVANVIEPGAKTKKSISPPGASGLTGTTNLSATRAARP